MFINAQMLDPKILVQCSLQVTHTIKMAILFQAKRGCLR